MRCDIGRVTKQLSNWLDTLCLVTHVVTNVVTAVCSQLLVTSVVYQRPRVNTYITAQRYRGRLEALQLAGRSNQVIHVSKTKWGLHTAQGQTPKKIRCHSPSTANDLVTPPLEPVAPLDHDITVQLFTVINGYHGWVTNRLHSSKMIVLCIVIMFIVCCASDSSFFKLLMYGENANECAMELQLVVFWCMHIFGINKTQKRCSST